MRKATKKICSILLTVCLMIGLAIPASIPASAADIDVTSQAELESALSGSEDTINVTGSFTLVPNSIITVPANKTVIINSGVSLDSGIGTLDFTVDGRIEIYGTLRGGAHGGTFTNNGEVYVGASGWLDISNNYNAVINNGMIENDGMVRARSLTNNGTFINNGAIPIPADITNNGALTGSGTQGTISGTNSIEYTISFDENYTGGNVDTVSLYAANMGVLMPQDPVRTDYQFVGWNTAQDGTGSAFDSTTTLTADITAYAQWAVAPTITSADSYTCTAGIGGSFSLAATGTAPITFALAGTYPAGVSVNGSDLIVTAAVPAGTYSFLIEATNAVGTSPQQSFTLTVKEATPSASIDYAAETLTGLVANASYTINSVAISADGNGKIAIHSAWFGTGVSIVKFGATSATDSAPQNLLIPSRSAAPSGLSSINTTTIGGSGGIDGTTTAMEYSTDQTNWTNCITGSTTGLAQGIYYVRTKAVENTSFASAQTIVMVSAAADKDITAFSIDGIDGVINEGSGTIAVTVPYGTNVTSLAPFITHTGANISPDSGVAQDFSSPVFYTVIAADSSAKSYVVTVTVAPYSGSSAGGSSTTYYTVKFDANGGSSVSSQSVAKNGTVTKPANPMREGYTFTGWYTDADCEILYDFSAAVKSSFTLYAGWEETEAEPLDNPFSDVHEDDWFYGDVEYVYENGLMLGTSDTAFAPQTAVSRAMVVAVLWRLAGEPESKGDNPFTDLMQDWYTEAVIWAADNEIVFGYGDGKFGPDDSITREQLATMLYRYCEYKGIDVSASADLSGYTDAGSISSWALEVIKWANAGGLITGRSATELAPQGTATRAELAAILHRFIENVIG